MKTATPPYDITTGVDEQGDWQFTAIGAPTIWHRGYKIEQWGHNVTVYDMSGDRPRAIWGEYTGSDAFEDCVKWLDANRPEDGEIAPHYQRQHEIWQEAHRPES